MADDKPTLLVGCGINIAFNASKQIIGSSNFTYEEILPKMFQNDGDLSASQSKFKNYYNLGGRNLEEFLRYEFVGAYASLCEDEKEATKNEFVRILGEEHHKLPILSAMNNFGVFKTNLIAFKTIYTTNYDLKLYYLMKKLDLFGTKQNSYKLFNDCFYPYKKEKVESRSCSIHLFQDVHPNVPWSMVYLHGSLHLFGFSNTSDPTGCGYKLVNATHNNLIKNRNEICRKNGFHDLIVLSGTTEEKKEIIEKNTYLTQALESLKAIKGELIIYGCSIDDNDKHIWEAIRCNSNIDNIYIGISGNSGERKRIAEHFKGRTISFYSHGDLNIWEKVDWFGNIKIGSIRYPV